MIRGGSAAATVDETPKTILVVENDVLVRMVISDYLRRCAYKVIEAADSNEALEILQHSELTIDVVLSGVELPGSMDGFGLAHWIRQHRQGLEVILVGTSSRAAQAAADLCERGQRSASPMSLKLLSTTSGNS